MAARSRSPPAKRALALCHSEGDAESPQPSEDDSDMYYCEVCGEPKESVGVLVNAVSIGEQIVENICLDCSYEHVKPNEPLVYVQGRENGWRYCSVCSLHYSPTSDNCLADWRFPGQLLTCTHCREAWTLDGWNRKLKSILDGHVEFYGRKMLAGHLLSGHRLEFSVPVRCTRMDLITALEFASGERMAMWKVLSGDALVASAADKYKECRGETIVDEELLDRDLTLLKGATEDFKQRLQGRDCSDYGNHEIAALISFAS